MRQPILRTVTLDPVSIPDLDGWNGIQALVATSPRAFAGIAAPPPALPVYVVGQAAARAAGAAGCESIRVAANVRELVQMVRSTLSPGEGELFYCAGRDRARDLTRMLPDFRIRLAVVYAAEVNRLLLPAVRRAIAGGRISHVTVFSARAARTFVAACRRASVLSQARRIRALCMSRRIAAILLANGWRYAWGAPLPQADRLTERLIGRRFMRSRQPAGTATASGSSDVLKPT